MCQGHQTWCNVILIQQTMHKKTSDRYKYLQDLQAKSSSAHEALWSGSNYHSKLSIIGFLSLQVFLLT